MANFAVLHNKIVSNVIVCDSKEIAELVTGTTCIEYTNENPAGIGYTWDGSIFTKPTVEEITND
jgi:uncharacterized Ntn-hydrolase superfamily protein